MLQNNGRSTAMYECERKPKVDHHKLIEEHGGSQRRLETGSNIRSTKKEEIRR